MIGSLEGGERRWRTIWMGATGSGLLVLLLGALVEPGRAAFAYLTAYAFAFTLVIGSLFWVMIQHLTGAEWFVALRRTAEQWFRPLPLLALAFLPVLAGLYSLYPWSRPEQIADPHLRAAIQHKLVYLEPSFFALRAALYFAIWIACGALLRRWSLEQDAGGGDALGGRQRRLSAAGLPAAAFALQFAAVDWLMSLEPAWSSSVFGIYVFAGAALGSLALLTVTVFALQGLGHLQGVVRVSHYHALGKLLFTMLLFWAYIAFFQFFIIWIANVPEEVTWYLERSRGTWGAVALALGVGHFALPFAALLSRDLRRRPAALAAVSGWLLLMHYLDLYWVVIPAFGGAAPHWLDAAAFVAVFGALAGALPGSVRGEREVAVGDPRFVRALRFDTH